MAGQNQDQFEVYFRRADLDGDGRISGAEAVSFFQGSNLPKQVLAQIWSIADQSRTGFLGRQEFYNYLKLVTVAQSKRELTPDIVKAALYGPAAAKIPPPQINLPAVPLNQANPMAVAAAPVSAPAPAPATHMATVNPGLSQIPGFRGPAVPNMSMNQPYFPNQQSQPIKPMQAMTSGIASRPTPVAGPNFSMINQSPPRPAGTASTPSQLVPGGTAGLSVSNSNITSNWLGGSPGGPVPSTPTATSLPQTSSSVSSQPNAKDSRALVPPGNGVTTQSFFGGELFSAAAAAAGSTTRQDSKVPTYSSTITAASSTTLPVASGTRPAVKSNSLDSLQSAFATQPLGGQLQRAQSLPTSGQQVSTSSSSPLASSGISVTAPISSDTSQPSWPKMKPSDIQKYTKVFIEVDTDRDGRITGEQARDLFLSWRLQREVLKQVWDLSDQDGDSMLSLREFCFALYLMERHREGHPLPAVLPSNVMYDQTLLSMTGQPRVAYGNPGWGFGQQPGVGTRPMVPATGPRPPVPVNAFQPGGAMPGNQHIPRGSVLEDPSLDHNKMDQNSGNSIPDDGISLEKKVDETKLILDSKEKLEFYRTKMQELVLYKSRCDNRLNEITERAIADKREAEVLGKKYEEKYKQVAEVASKLTIEEATYRDIQERKLELQQAIVNVERGGSVDGLLQVRADRIQSDLDELMKALTDRCKKHGLDIKFTAAIELPFGWQPGIQEGAAPWDEDWDKFEDEGFSNDLTVDVKNVSASTKDAVDDSLTPDSSANGDGKLENLSTSGHALESESGYTHSDDESARSPQGSPARRTSLESPSQDFSDVFVRSSEADAETHRSFDESAWGAFDTNDDADSVWGFNAASTKDSDSEKHRDFFGSDDFGVKPVKTESPSAESIFQKKSIFFEESVPGTPQSRFGNSPRYSEAGDHFDSFSRFASFSMQEGGFSPRQERLSRFDSMSSTKDLGHGRAVSSFDDSDPFGSSGPFKVSSESEPAKKASDSWGSF